MHYITIHTKSGNIQRVTAEPAVFTAFKGWLAGGHSGQEEEWNASMPSLQSAGYGFPTQGRTAVAETFFFSEGAVIRSNIDTISWASQVLPVVQAQVPMQDEDLRERIH